MMNMDTCQDRGKVQWRWDNWSYTMCFHYSEHLLDDGFAMLYYLDKPNWVIIHKNMTSHQSDNDMLKFIERGFNIIDLKVDVIGYKVDRYVPKHGYTDLLVNINVQGEMI